MTVLILVTLLCYVGIVYAYFGYALVLYLLTLRKKRYATEPTESANRPSVTVLIAVRNEVKVIASKLENTLAACRFASSAGHEVEVIVASDCSDDGTDEAVLGYKDSGVVLVRSVERGGKERAQALALKQARGEIVVFTDAKVKLAEDGLVRFAQHFSDPTVGAVSSIDRVTTDAREGSGEGFYVRYEMWLRRLESEFNSLVGLSGSCFAVRRILTSDWRVDVPSDFVAMILAKRAGLRGVLAEDIPCSYKSVSSEKEEFGRKVRTVLRGITAFFAFTEVCDPRRYGTFTLQIISHKLCRWLVPWFFIVATVGSLILAPNCSLFALLFVADMLLLALAHLGYWRPELRSRIIFKIPLFFVLSNAAVFVAWLRFLRGDRAVIWNPSEKAV